MSTNQPPPTPCLPTYIYTHKKNHEYKWMMLIYNSNCTLEMLMILMEIWQMAQKQNDTKAHDTVMK